MTRQQRQHRSEFKAKVALEAIHGEWTLNELALGRGQPEIFNSGLCGAAQERRDADQHGWPRLGPEPRICRTVVAHRDV